MERAKLLKLLKAEANKEKIVRMSLRELGTRMGLSGEYVRILIGELEALSKIAVSRSKSRRNYITIL
jgi:CTP-dependent riboflavin kinase